MEEREKRQERTNSGIKKKKKVQLRIPTSVFICQAYGQLQAYIFPFSNAIFDPSRAYKLHGRYLICLNQTILLWGRIMKLQKYLETTILKNIHATKFVHVFGGMTLIFVQEATK